MEKILIATDFSNPAENALRYGSALAARLDTQLVLVHAYSLPLAGYDSMAPLNVVSEMQSASAEALQEARGRIVKELGRDPGIECITEASSVHALIEDACNKTGAELIVMGITGHAGGMKKHVIGSSVVETVRNLKVPVLIVPEGISYGHISTISFAYDSGDKDLISIIIASRYFAKLFNASLELVHVSNGTENAASGPDEKEVGQILKGTSHSIIDLSGNDVVSVLEQHYKKTKPDLVMLSPHRHNLFKTLFSSSTTEKLIYSLHSPILCFHAG